jgi:hypothetical protein
MEFEDKNTKYLFTAIGAAFILTLLFGGFKMYEYERDQAVQSQKRRDSCKNLDLRFGDIVTVKEGFYQDELFIAVDQRMVYNSKGEFESYRLKSASDLQKEILTFRCEDLKLIKRKGDS